LCLRELTKRGKERDKAEQARVAAERERERLCVLRVAAAPVRAW